MKPFTTLLAADMGRDGLSIGILSALKCAGHGKRAMAMSIKPAKPPL